MRVSRVWRHITLSEVSNLGLLFLLHPAFSLGLMAFSPGLRWLSAVKLITRASSAAIGYNTRSLIWIKSSPWLILVWFWDILNGTTTKVYDCLKGQGQVTVNKPVISRIYIVAHCMAIVSCTDFVGWGESKLKLLLKIHQHLCNHTTYVRFVCFSTKYKSPSSK